MHSGRKEKKMQQPSSSVLRLGVTKRPRPTSLDVKRQVMDRGRAFKTKRRTSAHEPNILWLE